MSISFDTLVKRLMESNGDYCEIAVTTSIIANNYVTSTNLNEYDFAADDQFNNWWIYIKDGSNTAVDRRVKDYTTSGGVAEVYGATLTPTVGGSGLPTIQISRYSRTHVYEKAIQRAIEEIYPSVKRYIEDTTLITGNNLPNSHFEDWAVSTYPDYYSMVDSNITAAADTTAGEFRGGAKAMKATTGASGAGKYVLISSSSWPRLLDLMGKTVDFKCWVYPEKADDASITIYTIKPDGTTTQTLTSTTACPITKWTLLELKGQAINDDISLIEIRFNIATASKYVIFDDARIVGHDRRDYHLPAIFDNGNVDRVYIQTMGYSDDICDDIDPQYWAEVTFSIVEDKGTKYLRLTNLSTNSKRIKLQGTAPLETLSSASDTITLNETKFSDKLIAYARYLLYEMVEQPVSNNDIDRFERAKAKAFAKYLSMSGMHAEASMLKGL